MPALVAVLTTLLVVVSMLGANEMADERTTAEPAEAAAEGETQQFSLNRLAGPDRFATAARIAEHHHPNPERVYLATGSDFPDALAAGAVAGANDAPVLLTASESLPEATSSALQSLDPDEVVVVGGEGAISEEVAIAAAHSAAADQRRVAGADRIGTAAELADELISDVDAVYVATSEGFADALAGGAVAGLEGAPLLLTAGDSLPAATAAVIERLDPERVEVLGGTAVVTDGVMTELQELTAATVTRYAGADRFATAAQIIDAHVDETDSVYLATGEDYPDALSGGAAAASAGAALVLTGSEMLPDVSSATVSRLAPWELTVLGGENAVSDTVALAAGERVTADHHRPGHCGGPPRFRASTCNDDGDGEDGEVDDGHDHGEEDPAEDDIADGDDPGDEVDNVFSGDVSKNGFTVPAGETWAFDPGVDTTVETDANVIVKGTLQMKPASADVTHTLKFVGIDETEFVGGGMELLDSDVGLWVVENGQLDLQGTERQGWNREGDHATWRDGDEIRRAPIEQGVTDEFPEFAAGDGVPRVTAPDGSEHRTEVFNLTRNVRIHGGGSNPADIMNDNGRTHVMCLMCNKPQTIKYVEFRWVGPRAPHDRDGTRGMLGRYGVHFHHNGDGSRGSIVEGTVIRDYGSNAYVPHESNGVTFTDTIAYDGFGAGYWWDGDDHTNDVTFDSTAVFLQHAYPDFRGYDLHGYTLGEGQNMTVRDSVVVGNHGKSVNAGGFMWPDSANHADHSTWTFENNVAHNNRDAGIAVWQNDSNEHVISNYVGFHNGQGISHGAYLNGYEYLDALVFDNDVDLHQHSLSHSLDFQKVFDGLDAGTVLISKHSLGSSTPVIYRNAHIRDGVTVNEDRREAGVIEFRYDCDHGGILLSADDFDLVETRSEIVIYNECTGNKEVVATR